MDDLVLESLTVCVDIIANDDGKTSKKHVDLFMSLYQEIYRLETEEFDDARISDILKPMAKHMINRRTEFELGNIIKAAREKQTENQVQPESSIKVSSEK